MGNQEAAFDHLTEQYSGNGGTALAMMAKTARIRIFMVTSLQQKLCQLIGVTRINAEEVGRHAADAGDMAVITNASMLIR
jgi:hypothetical protein